MKAAIIAICLVLSACAQEPKIISVATIPTDLPKPDEKFLQKFPPPGCVKDKRPKVPVRVVTSERDCFRDRALIVEGRLDALQTSVREVNASIDKLRGEAAQAAAK